MAYVDGNTVTALWNYAQNFTLNDNSFQTSFGQSLEGHINLVSGQTHGAEPQNVDRHVSRGTVIGDIDPAFDDCSKDRRVAMTGTNVGELLNRARVTWGWFQGGFAPTRRADGKPVCDSSHQNIVGDTVPDYVPHHEPFQYYSATATRHTCRRLRGDGRPHRPGQPPVRPVVVLARGRLGNQPAGQLPEGGPLPGRASGFSDPLDEQHFWSTRSTGSSALPTGSRRAIIVAYDDSGGWYDHVVPKIIRSSYEQQFDSLSGRVAAAATTSGHLPAPLRLRRPTAAARDLALRAASTTLTTH